MIVMIMTRAATVTTLKEVMNDQNLNDDYRNEVDHDDTGC